MDERLMEVAREGNIDRLYALIREDSSILERNFDDKLLVDTPLHVAASVGNHHFAAEVMRLKPSYARKLNLDGLSPIQLALLGGHDRMVEWFVLVDSSLVHDKGREGTTPLHFVVAVENANLLRLFLLACPDSIEDLTTRRETALHIALKFHKLRIFEVLVRWLKRAGKEYVLNWPDEDGNTVLHMATSKNQIEAVKLLSSKKLIKKIKTKVKNNMGLTALDIFQLPMELDNREIGDLLCRAKALRGISINHDPLQEIDQISKEMSLHLKLDKYIEHGVRKKSQDKDMSPAVLMVAVLIATATFQAVLSPPGGLWQDESNHTTTAEGIYHKGPHVAGSSTMTPAVFCAFYFLNSVTFYASMSIIRLHTMGLPHKLLDISQIFLGATYFCSLISIFPYPGSEKLFFSLLFLPLCAQNIIQNIAFFRTSWWLRLLFFLNKRIRVRCIFSVVFPFVFFILVILGI